MPNFNKQINDTCVRIGEVRFSFVNVFAPRKKEDGTDGKYGCAILIPKTDKMAEKIINAAYKAATNNGKATLWNGKIPRNVGESPLRDGDDEHPDDDAFKGMWFINAASQRKPGVAVLENGVIADAMSDDDFYSGCWGAAVINFYPFAVPTNQGVAAGLNNVIKTRDDDKLGGGSRSAASDFADLADDLLG